MKQSKGHIIDFVFVLSLFLVLTVCGLLLVFMGSNVYKKTAEDYDNSFSERTTMAFLAKQVRQNKSLNAIKVGNVEGEKALVIREENEFGIFDKYIYCYDKKLCEIYAKESFIPVLSAGKSLVDIENFDVNIDESGFLTLTIENFDNEKNSLTLSLLSE